MKKDPTQQEIRERCETIQAQWSEVERKRRAAQTKRWIPQIINMQEIAEMIKTTYRHRTI